MTTIHTTTSAASQIGATATTLDAAGSGAEGPLLPDPTPMALGGDSITAIATLVAEADQQDASAANKLQDEADQAACQQESQRVSQMMDKADQDEAAGLASGIGDIAGGVAMGVGGFLSDGTGEGAKAADGAAGTNWRMVAEGAGKALPGVGAIVSGGYKAEGDRDDARAASFEAGAQVALRAYDESHSREQAAQASVQKVADFLSTLQQTEAASRSAAASMLRG
jgi:hypothetical protein